jgi:drug/metabolite transporter (DMT)-like permease
MTHNHKAIVYALMAVFFWSTVASAFKLSLRYLSFIELLLFASLASLVVLFCVLCAQHKIRLLFALKKQELAPSILYGFLNPFLYYIILFKAYDLLPAQAAQPLNYTWAVMFVLLSVFFLKQKITKPILIGTLVSFSGVFLITTRGNFRQFNTLDSTGVALALGSSVIWASYWIFNIRDKLDEIVRLFLNFFFGIFYIVIVYIVFSDIKMPSISGIAGALYVGLFEMGFTFILWLKALRLTDHPARISNLIYLSPFLSLVFIRIFVGETILLTTIMGLGLIILGIVYQRK